MQSIPFWLGRRRMLTSAIALLALPAAGADATAASTAAVAEQVVERLVGRLWQLMSDDGVDPATWQQAIESETDLRLLGRLALGRHWRALNAAERAEFEELFRAFVVRMLVQRLRPYVGNHLGRIDERFQIVASRPAGKKDVVVQSRVVPPSGAPLRVDWRLRDRADAPVIIDLIVEGVSLLLTQRAEFAAVLEREGTGGLLTQLRRRLTETV